MPKLTIEKLYVIKLVWYSFVELFKILFLAQLTGRISRLLFRAPLDGRARGPLPPVRCSPSRARWAARLLATSAVNEGFPLKGEAWRWPSWVERCPALLLSIQPWRNGGVSRQLSSCLGGIKKGKKKPPVALQGKSYYVCVYSSNIGNTVWSVCKT